MWLCTKARATGLLAATGLAACGAGPSSSATAERRSPDLVSRAERTGWIHTGDHAEAVRMCRDFALAYPGRARCDQFGTTPEGRAMVALVVGSPDARRPVLLIQAGIHAGEIEGKDAGFWLLRDLLDGHVARGALDAATIVFVPILNPDGHERSGPDNRPNQRGPAEMGFRTNAQNLNLNRDYTKVDTPEIAAVLRLWRRWDPVVYVDLHTTDGARFEHDVAVMVSPRAPGDRLQPAARSLSDRLQARLTQLGHLPLSFYPSFVVQDDPASGFDDFEAPPRFSQAYAGTRGRLGILVETHSWHTYKQRGLATYHVLQALVERAARDATSWRDLAREADAAGANLAGKQVPLAFVAGGAPRTIEFRGYHYERHRSEISGATWITYDEKRPEVWRVPLRDQTIASVVVTAPRAGYLVTAGFAGVVARRLESHDIRFSRLGRALTVDAEVFRATRVEPEPSFEGRARVTLGGGWTRERRTVPPGALWIPLAQPRARLAMHLLEPQAPDSLASWGFFNASFEQKEYMEPYVAEEVAREMLKDRNVRAAFDKALEDPAFAASPQRRLEFFYRRHASWDEGKDLLPVLRLDAPP
jgi:hypothetical protein